MLARVLGPVRAATLRSRISDIWRAGFKATGRYAPIPKTETDVVLSERLTFKGDAPAPIADGAHEQGRMKFRIPRPVFEEAQNLVVTPKGGGWLGGALHERYSACKPGLRMLLESHRPQEEIEAAWFVQSAHKDTYGDWVSEYLCAIMRASPLDAPLLLPLEFAKKAYVARDLAAFGVDWRPVTHPIAVARAKVLRQQKFFVHFPREDAAVLRRLFPVHGGAARPGSLVYISREGERSEVAQRAYPSLMIEAAVRARGGRVVRAATASASDYSAAAAEAETVIYDHGSAIYNAVGWPMRRAIEIASGDWWNNSFLMLLDAVGVRDHTIIRADFGEAHVAKRLADALDAPLDGGPHS